MAILISPAEAHREGERPLGVLTGEISLRHPPQNIWGSPVKSTSGQELPALGEHRPAPRRAQSEFLGAGKRRAEDRADTYRCDEQVVYLPGPQALVAPQPE